MPLPRIALSALATGAAGREAELRRLRSHPDVAPAHYADLLG